MTIAGTVIAAVISAALVWIGIRFLVVPRAAAAGYGIPADPDGDAGTYLSVKGNRDLACALMIAVPLILGAHTVAGWILFAGSVAAFADCLTVLRRGGPKIVAYAVHAGTGVLAVVGGLLLLLG
ncbi:DUF4267 domain-containing protein [Actinocatenispora sera]|uniref:Membrane protein n=1 Tax=Actinocatenispora sera TaxID=390989 RepID=A0A810LBX5_9ACTN|nr:DUF4267 domain-containing protein [Actinocatenispora sera]BCJ32385.1 membrane protein [Actinocatenispora sera]